MATASFPDSSLPKAADATVSDIQSAIWTVLKYAGSLKITCAMFLLGVVILFVGTT